MERETLGAAATDRTLDLLARAREGDSDALDQLFARHIPLLRRWASGRLPRWARDIADTPDLVQETAFQTFTHLDEMPARNSGDLRIEKIIRVRSANIGLYGDLFNVANHIVAGRINNVSGSAFGQVRWYTSPREFRAGVRVTF